jgi:hypothetical protein
VCPSPLARRFIAPGASDRRADRGNAHVAEGDLSMRGGRAGRTARGWVTCQVGGLPGTREAGPVHVVRPAKAATAAGCSPRADDAKARAVPPRRAAVPPRRAAPQEHRTAGLRATLRHAARWARGPAHASAPRPARPASRSRPCRRRQRAPPWQWPGRARPRRLYRPSAVAARHAAPKHHHHSQHRRRRWPGLHGRHERCRQHCAAAARGRA